jgi:hypothetical protein
MLAGSPKLGSAAACSAAEYSPVLTPSPQVAQAVYDLIGGEVDHASTDEDDLSDDTKVVRRLAALNLLATQGWSPTLGFWEVRTGPPNGDICICLAMGD